MDNKTKKNYLTFLSKKDELKESLAKDFTSKLSEMNSEDIAKLSWFPSSKYEAKL
jgi:bacillopeptidase F (M6 metalloprotease family)